MGTVTAGMAQLSRMECRLRQSPSWVVDTMHHGLLLALLKVAPTPQQIHNYYAVVYMGNYIQSSGHRWDVGLML